MSGAKPRVSTERELKLSAWPQFALPNLDRAVKGAHALAPSVTRLDAAYYDTSDLRLLRRGVTLRFRRGETGGDLWTLKLPPQGDDLGLSRREISLPGTAGAMPRLLRDLARGWAVGAPLARVATIQTTRTTTRLVDTDKQPLATVDDDEVCGLRGQHVAARFREIEIELAEDAPAKALRALAKALTAAGAMPAAQIPKLARTLGAAADEPWDLTAPEQAARPTAGTALQARLVDSLALLVEHHAAIFLDGDSSAVGALAEASARLRNDLRLFGALLDEDATAPLTAELDRLAARISASCEQMARLADLRAEVTAHDMRDAAPLLAAIAEDDAQARERLRTLLRGARHARLLAGLRDLALDPPLTSGKAKRRATSVMPTIAAGDARRLRDAVAAHADTELEGLSATVAELRHVVDLAAGFTDVPAALHQDAKLLEEVACRALRATATAARLRELSRRGDGRQAWTAGVLAGIELERTRAAVGRVPAARRDLLRKAHWGWLG